MLEDRKMSASEMFALVPVTSYVYHLNVVICLLHVIKNNSHYYFRSSLIVIGTILMSAE